MKAILFPLKEKVIRLPIPRVGGIRLRVGGKLPLLRESKPRIEDYDKLLDLDPVQEIPQPPTEIAPEVKPEVKPAEKMAREVVVKVLPTPKRRGPREPKVEPAPAPPPEPKPLKVIRRRREEEPKIFVTLPRLYSDAMLGGMKAKSAVDDEG